MDQLEASHKQLLDKLPANEEERNLSQKFQEWKEENNIITKEKLQNMKAELKRVEAEARGRDAEQRKTNENLRGELQGAVRDNNDSGRKFNLQIEELRSQIKKMEAQTVFSH